MHFLRYISPVQEILPSSWSHRYHSFSEAVWLVWGAAHSLWPQTSGHGLRTWCTSGQPEAFFPSPPAPRLGVLSLTLCPISSLTGFADTGKRPPLSPLTQGRWGQVGPGSLQGQLTQPPHFLFPQHRRTLTFHTSHMDLS